MQEIQQETYRVTCLKKSRAVIIDRYQYLFKYKTTVQNQYGRMNVKGIMWKAIIIRNNL